MEFPSSIKYNFNKKISLTHGPPPNGGSPNDDSRIGA